MYLAEMTICIVVFSLDNLGKTLWYIQFSFVHQEVTKAIYQHILIRMLTMCIMLIPPQLRNVLFFEPKLVKEVECNSVCGQGGKKMRASKDCIQKDISKALGVLDNTPWKKICKVFSPS